ncbi:hypothetical protein FGB62_37g128 [Gracilaria domingensis]|nr:hypothetical protein FGB62_37g128 [Gracilaria domingensis]
MSRFVGILVILLVCEYAWGAPIARMMGCGKGKTLSQEKQSFCCEHFNLDCPTARAVNADSTLANSVEDESNNDKLEFKVRVRTLGQACKAPLYVCGVGLECKQGLCFRIKTKAHLKRLMSRGREVEKEERQFTRDGEDVEEEDPLPARKGLILEGQSLKLSEGERGSPPQAITQRAMGRSPRNEGEPMDLEEDEVAANIWDLLAKTMGIKLSPKQIHNVREVIAGTIDERAEREEQIDDAEGNTSPAGNDTEMSDFEKTTAQDIGTTFSSRANERRENKSKNGNPLEFSNPSVETGSEMKQLKEDCGSHSDSRSQEMGMQCPA